VIFVRAAEVSVKIFETETRHEICETKYLHNVTNFLTLKFGQLDIVMNFCKHFANLDWNFGKFWIVFSIFGCRNSSIGVIKKIWPKHAHFPKLQFAETRPRIQTFETETLKNVCRDRDICFEILHFCKVSCV